MKDEVIDFLRRVAYGNGMTNAYTASWEELKIFLDSLKITK